ncbi:MAG: DUF6273 domain-containing protein [Muribaculaceae bacterium]|nr:DUF6273 domain-containing protein [Roseburia sp.]MCM1431309.1 DUF6273 domain-containing protein [Muribaculaceae bacterium]MCM1492205.1 DUF6273 domain-containing protein [Muribaculaceae bacterium]
MGEKHTVLFFVLLSVVLVICGCGRRDLTIEKIAYDKSKDNPLVYIKENDEYVPYLVLTSDYNGNTLLLRKYVLPELRAYKEHEAGWGSNENGSYYEKSTIDDFLNSAFLDSLSEETRELVVDSTIEVTDMDRYHEWEYVTHEISRKVFLLSSVELGIKGFDGYITTREGTPLKYFKDKEYSVKVAYFQDGSPCPYWTRTPNLWATCLVVTITTKGDGDSTAERVSGVRPAFCISGQTAVKESSEIVEGEMVYVIE